MVDFSHALSEDRLEQLDLRNAIAVDSHTLARAAIAMMRHNELGCAVIVDDHQRPHGIFTERSVISMLLRGSCLDQTSVSQFTDPLFICMDKRQTVKSAWKTILDTKARFICVTNDDGSLFGVTGQRGLATYLAKHCAENPPTEVSRQVNQASPQQLDAGSYHFPQHGA